MTFWQCLRKQKVLQYILTDPEHTASCRHSFQEHADVSNERTAEHKAIEFWRVCSQHGCRQMLLQGTLPCPELLHVVVQVWALRRQA